MPKTKAKELVIHEYEEGIMICQNVIPDGPEGGCIEGVVCDIHFKPDEDAEDAEERRSDAKLIVAAFRDFKPLTRSLGELVERFGHAVGSESDRRAIRRARKLLRRIRRRDRQLPTLKRTPQE